MAPAAAAVAVILATVVIIIVIITTVAVAASPERAFAQGDGDRSASNDNNRIAAGPLAVAASGSRIVATVWVENAGRVPGQYVLVLEARSSDGVTAFLGLTSGALGPGQRASAETEIVLPAGSYALRAFSIDSVSRPLLFSPVISAQVAVPPDANVVVAATADAAPPPPLPPPPAAEPLPVPASGRTGIYVPLYKFPDLADPEGVWNTLLKAKREHPQVPFVVTINPASGPGQARNAAYASAIPELGKAGVEHVLGYIPTRYGSQEPGFTLADIKAMIDRYRAWYPDVDGIMLDQASSEGAKLAFYAEIAQYARSQGLEFVRANPGTKADAQYYRDAFFDNVAIYEGRSLPAIQQLQENTRHPEYAPQGFSFTARGVQSLDPAYVKQAAMYVGLLYITDDLESDGDRNPYNSLPPYFGQLVALLGRQ